MSNEIIPPLLTIQYRGAAGSPQVFRLLGGTTLIPVGPPLPGATYETPSDSETLVNNRVISFQDRVIACHQNKVYLLDEGSETTDGDDTWLLVHTFTLAHTTDNFSRKSGIHKVNVNNIQTLVIMYLDTTQRWRMSSSTDGISWVDSASLNITTVTASNPLGRSSLFNNKIYMVWGDGATTRDIIELDPALFTVTYHNVTSWVSTSITPDLCVFDNRLWAIGWKSVAQDFQPNLVEFDGGTFVERIIFPSTVDHATHANLSGMCLFTDGVEMFAIIPADSNANQSGNFAFKLSLSAGSGSSLTSAEITNDVIPTSLKSPVAGPFFDNFRWFAFQDNHTNPTTPCIHLWVQDADVIASGSSAYYLWNGPNTLIGNPPGTGQLGPGIGLAMPHAKNGGGDRIWTSGQAKIEIIGRNAAESGQELDFMIWGNPTTPYRVRFFYDIGDEVATIPATLRAASLIGGGAIFGADSESDYVDIIGADGLMLYSIIWETVLDSVPKNQIATLMPSIKEI